MRKLLVCALVAVWAWTAVGCSEPGAGKTSTEKKFQELHKQYSARFNEQITKQAETMVPVEVTREAARIWDEVFGPNKALVAKRVEEVLKDLDPCPAIQEDQYSDVASATRDPSAPADKAWKVVVSGPNGPQTVQLPLPDEVQDPNLILKQFRWNPLGDARLILDGTLRNIMREQSYVIRQVMVGNASLLWEALDRSVDHPKLCLRQPPMIYIVEMSRKDDYYQAEKFRWLKPKMAEPPAALAPPAGGEIPPIAAPPATTPRAAAPVPPAAPAPAPAAPAAPAGKAKG